MYSKEESVKLKERFWTSFGRYMSPIPSADGEKINWINYRTGEKYIRFAMEADNKSAEISIIISHPDAGMQELYYEQLLQLKYILHDTLGEEWHWENKIRDNSGKLISKVSWQATSISIFNEEDWPTLISFFKPRLIALDEFWSLSRTAFELLR